MTAYFVRIRDGLSFVVANQDGEITAQQLTAADQVTDDPANATPSGEASAFNMADCRPVDAAWLRRRFALLAGSPPAE